jgi:hypothetical protein
MVDKPGAPARAWQRMLSGRGSTCSIPRRSMSRFPISPTGLPALPAGTARPAATTPFRSRSIRLLVEEIFREQVNPLPEPARLMALLHDAPEYVIGDMISPFKSVVGGGYKASSTGCRRRSTCGFRSAGHDTGDREAQDQERRQASRPSSRRPSSPASSARRRSAAQ